MSFKPEKIAKVKSLGECMNQGSISGGKPGHLPDSMKQGKCAYAKPQGLASSMKQGGLKKSKGI